MRSIERYYKKKMWVNKFNIMGNVFRWISFISGFFIFSYLREEYNMASSDIIITVYGFALVNYLQGIFDNSQ